VTKVAAESIIRPGVNGNQGHKVTPFAITLRARHGKDTFGQDAGRDLPLGDATCPKCHIGDMPGRTVERG